jgi:hypothetical protein
LRNPIFSPEQKLLLAILRETLEGTLDQNIDKLIKTSSLDWNKFLLFAQIHELIPFAYGSLSKRSALIPKDTLTFLKTRYYCIVTYTQYLWDDFCRIIDAFKAEGISIVPIKGMALLKDIYIHLPVRTMVDIDLLVKEAQIAKAECIFENLGYRKKLYGLSEGYWRKQQTHFSFYKEALGEASAVVDLHWGLDFPQKGRKLLPLLWERVKLKKIEDRQINLLSREDLFLSLVLHQRRFGKPLCLKYALDAALLLKYPPGLDWDYILQESRRSNLKMSIFFILALAKLITGNGIPNHILKKLHVPFWKQKMATRFIEKNVFLSTLDTSKRLYAKSIFYLYDNLQQPLSSIFCIPKERFAKFYNLDLSSARTQAIYKWRFFYILGREIKNIFCFKKRRI